MVFLLGSYCQDKQAFFNTSVVGSNVIIAHGSTSKMVSPQPKNIFYSSDKYILPVSCLGTGTKQHYNEQIF